MNICDRTECLSLKLGEFILPARKIALQEKFCFLSLMIIRPLRIMWVLSLRAALRFMNICNRTQGPSRDGGGCRTPAQVAPGRKPLRRAGRRRHPQRCLCLCHLREQAAYLPRFRPWQRKLSECPQKREAFPVRLANKFQP
jgi:hypothetical protein